MNKRKLLAITDISGVIMASSAFSALAGTSGYEAYKSALKNTKTAQSLTSQIKVSLADNGKTIVTANSVVKADLTKEIANKSVAINSNGKSTTLEMYGQDKQMVLKKSGDDVYYLVDKRGSKHHNFKENNEELQKDMENLVDALTQNLQNQITMQEGENGAKKIALHLSGAEIPLAVNTMGSLLVKHVPQAQEKHQNATKPYTGVKPELPKLKKQIQIKEIRITADVNADNYIDEQTANIVVSGKDAQGIQHEVTLNLTADFSSFNQTVVTPVDLTGKQVQKITKEHKNFNNQ